ncbi:hypothetical protein AVEN_101846-1 [Araneus ventricosus]|uniref:Uncharacterized protein n=1 Tax=Araneus ventricosus TaxID=182803 RepID=A0A4Y2RE97_ARAVE|nr:hypothetical protein AVEN_101846-1 [Araneus ventricosus]
MTEASPQHLLDCFALVYDDLLKRPDFVLEVKSNDVMDLIRFRSEGLQRKEFCFRSENSPILPELPKVHPTRGVSVGLLELLALGKSIPIAPEYECGPFVQPSVSGIGVFPPLEIRRRTLVVCVFSKLHKLNFEAAEYIDLIDWSNCVVTEPPLTMHIKDKDLREMCKEEHFPVLTFEEFSIHAQPVERCVKLISEAAMNVCGETTRHGSIRA